MHLCYDRCNAISTKNYLIYLSYMLIFATVIVTLHFWGTYETWRTTKESAGEKRMESA